MNKLRIYLIALILSPVLVAQEIPHNNGSSSMMDRGDAYFESMAYTKALKEYQRALEKNPRDKEVQLKIAQCYEKLNNPEEVAYYSSQSVSHSSADANDVYEYAEALSSTENYDKADRIYARYAQMNASDSRTERKREGLDEVESLYEDSLGYKVKPASFNTDVTEFAPAFIGGDLMFVSNRGKAKFLQKVDMRDETFFLDLYKLNGSEATKVEGLNDHLHEGPMSELEDGKVIITTNYPHTKKNSLRNDPSKLRMLIYEEGAEEWEQVSEFPHNSMSYSVGHPSYDAENKVLYFASNMSGGKGGVDIYKVSYSNGDWGSPENVEAINTEGDEMFPFVQMGDLYFASNGRGGLGGLDIYKTKADGGVIYTMGFPVNTSRDDFGIVLGEDGKNGYFSSNREGGEGMDDIYEVTIYKLRLEAKPIDEETGESVGGNWTVVDTRTGDKANFSKQGDKAVFDGLRGRSYTVTTDDEYYAESSGSFTADTKEDNLSVNVPMKRTKAPVEIEGAEGSEYVVVHNLAKPQTYKLGLHKLELVNENDLTEEDKPIVIEDVFFKFNSDEIVSGVNEIDKVIAILKGYEDVEVELTAYCDARGSSRYNEKLAERRAQRVEDYMKANQINPDRISSVNIGENDLYNNCKKCNEEDHQQNRRVEFTLRINK